MKTLSRYSMLSLLVLMCHPVLAETSTADKAEAGMVLPAAFPPTDKAEAGGVARTFNDCAPITLEGKPGRATIVYAWRAQTGDSAESLQWRLESMQVEIMPADAAARCG